PWSMSRASGTTSRTASRSSGDFGRTRALTSLSLCLLNSLRPSLPQTCPMFYTEPIVTVVARPSFTEPSHLPVNWLGESTDGERLAEFAGRLCYMSQHNPANRATKDYLENIKRQGHGSVLEHATYSLLLEGVSRSLTHELVRHRAGFAYSQLSQRYVDESEANFVVPPALIGDEKLMAAWQEQVEAAQRTYRELVDSLMTRYQWVADK